MDLTIGKGKGSIPFRQRYQMGWVCRAREMCTNCGSVVLWVCSCLTTVSLKNANDSGLGWHIYREKAILARQFQGSRKAR